MPTDQMISAVGWWVLAALASYGVIRLAVFHALRDTDRRRIREHERSKPDAGSTDAAR